MKTLKNVTVKTEYYYADGENRQSYRLVLELPLPGGRAVYELPVDKKLYDNLNLAEGLVK